MKTIVTPIDFSAVTPRVLATATDLAKALNGKLVLVHVIQPPVSVNSSDPILFENTARITAAAERAADRHIALIEKGVRDDHPATEARRITGPPVARILDLAAKLSADYIVIGSHGHTSLYDLLVGSTANGVLKGASCPVVVVPAEGRQSP
jgi:nucleotide-binding universal stress UspA family protein